MLRDMGHIYAFFTTASIALWTILGFVAHAYDTGPKQGTGVEIIAVFLMGVAHWIIGLLILTMVLWFMDYARPQQGVDAEGSWHMLAASIAVVL